MRRGEQPWQTNRSRVLRDAETSAEGLLWQRLRDRRLDGFKFVRQLPIGPYFADLACRELRVIVEIDGATHFTDHELAKDVERTGKLEAMGYRIYRVTNTDVYNNMRGVLDGLLHLLREIEGGRATSLSPATGGGEGARRAGEGQPLAPSLMQLDDGGTDSRPRSPSLAEPAPVPAAAPHPPLRGTLSPAKGRGRGKTTP
jgi:very-short-patch-repair endonuclease